MNQNQKESKFFVPERPKEKIKWKRLGAGLIVILVAGFCASATQRGIDGFNRPSALGFIALIVVGVCVAYVLERMIRKHFFSIKIVKPDSKDESTKPLSSKGKERLEEHLRDTGQMSE